MSAHCSGANRVIDASIWDKLSILSQEGRFSRAGASPSCSNARFERESTATLRGGPNPGPSPVPKARRRKMTAKKIVTLVVALLVVAMSATAGLSAAQTSKPAQKTQAVKLTFDDKGYVVTPDTVTKGVPVKMEVDLSTVKGCMRTVVINAFNVKQTVKEGATTIEFTPSKSGKIDIICGMNMGKGSFTVADPK
jgi:hypothetical protein